MAPTGAPPAVLADWAPGAAVFRLAGREVAHYVWRPDLPVASSPRPYLHPVRTLAGQTVTDAGPESHPHQLGISIATPDLDGRNFWGGRTFVAGHGPAWLDNHGIQRHLRWQQHTGTERVQVLEWITAHRPTTLLREQRTIAVRQLSPIAWMLGIRTRLTNATERAVAFNSPAGQGRTGAGYGGIFWRGPAVTGAVRVSSAAGGGVGAVHGKAADWVAVTHAGAWTMLFVPGDELTGRDRWFVRARDYLGVGLSLAWDRPLVLSPGETIARQVLAVVVDGAVTPAAAEQLATSARAVVS